MENIKLPVNAISLDQAQRWIANWRDARSINTEDLLAYIIPQQDIVDIQRREGKSWKRYRAYHAITDEGEYKLLIVGVDDNNNDLIKYPSQSDDVGISSNDYVYDLTRPCPSACDFSSPLMNP